MFYWLILALLNDFILLKLEYQGKLYPPQIALYNNIIWLHGKSHLAIMFVYWSSFNFNLLILFKYRFAIII